MRKIALSAIGFLSLALALALAISSGADARPRGGVVYTPPAASCPYAVDNGCSGANQSAQFINAAFFTNARQSGQAQYKDSTGTPSNHPSTINYAGVDYPVGHYTPDASLKDPLLYMATDPALASCSYSAASHTMTCSSAIDRDIEHYNWYGIGYYGSASSGGSLTFKDNHVTLTADNCRNYGGLGSTRHNAGAVTLTNNTFDYSSGCAFNADQYGTTAGTSLVQQSSFTASVSGSTMTIGSDVTGELRVGQYLLWPGRSTTPCIQAGGACTSITAISLTPATISSISNGGSGNLVTVQTATAHGLAPGVGIQLNGQNSSNYSGDAVVESVPDSTHFTYRIPYYKSNPSGAATTVGTYSIRFCTGSACNGITATLSNTNANGASGSFSTGPIQNSANGPFAGGSADINATYNHIDGSGQFIGTGTSGSIYARYNYERIVTSNGQHVNLFFNTPPANPIHVNIAMDGNTIVWDKEAEDGGTGTLDLFTSSAAASDAGPFIVDNLSVQKNVVVANSSLPNNSVNTNALARFLGQKGSGPDVLYSMSGGTLIITYMDGGTTPTSITPNTTQNLGTVVQCTTCNIPVQFYTQVSGTTGGEGTYTVSNTSDTVAQLTATLPTYRRLNPGSGYTTASVSITGGGGSGAAATATIVNGAITSYSVTNGGSGYTSAPTVVITDGSGTGASAIATISGGQVVSIAPNAIGSGYVSPSISFTGGGGSGAAATASVVNGAISAVTSSNAGSGYYSRPTVTITGDGTGASYQAVLNTTQTRRISNYNGTVSNTTLSDNLWDATGANGPYNIDIGNTWGFGLGGVNIVSTGNLNMKTGNTCNWGGTCN